MKITTLLLTTVLVTSIAFASETNSIENMTLKQEGVKYIKMLGGALKTQLQTQMKVDKSGLAAMGFCTAKAGDITKEVNQKLPEYASVRRTALKTRNENNVADALDVKIMQAYESSIEEKIFLSSEIKVVEEGNTTRIYKPLVNKGVCLKCHGSDISKEILEEIRTHYPKDQAVDFSEGSLRGVIVSEIKNAK